MIVDTQNVYGSSGDALGRRCKPDPAGVVEAFGRLGFAVQRVNIAIALPDAHDARRAADELPRQCRPLDRIEDALSLISMPSTLQTALDATRNDLRTASASAAWTPPAGLDMPTLLEATNIAAQKVHGEIAPAIRRLGDLIDRLVGAGSGSVTRVPGQWLRSMRVLLESRRRLEVITESVDSLSSYGYAGAANIAYRDSLPSVASGAVVEVLEGRFRRGRDGATPGEKQVDTLLAIACAEAARDAVAGGQQHAVIVLSDDDDLTPALARASQECVGKPVLVIVAGTGTVGSRHGSAPSGAHVPRWLTLDASAWCRICGVDPVAALVQRRVLASLVLGNRAAFTVDGDFATTGSGFIAKVDVRDLGAHGQHALGASRLRWGYSSARPLPMVEVSSVATPLQVGRVARARRARRTRCRPPAAWDHLGRLSARCKGPPQRQ